MSDFRDLSPNIVGSLRGLIISLGAVPGKSLLPGAFHPVAAGLADRFATAFVLIVRGDIADALASTIHGDGSRS